MDRYAVVGNPIVHSLSPRIHALFARQTGEHMEYTRLLAPLDAFAATVRHFRAEGGRGLNVTVPFKGEAWRMAERLSERAREAEAVNTLSFPDDGPIAGDNTDGVGLIRDLTLNQGIALAGRRILLLGAGGAARGVLGPLLARRPAALAIANRTPDKAHALAQAFGHAGSIAVSGFAELAGQRFDIIINATSAGLGGGVPPVPAECAQDAIAYDMVYGAKPTPFVLWARSHGARRALDGLGMLVEQAGESFFIWRGVRPESAPVLEALRRDDGA